MQTAVCMHFIILGHSQTIQYLLFKIIMVGTHLIIHEISSVGCNLTCILQYLIFIKMTPLVHLFLNVNVLWFAGLKTSNNNSSNFNDMKYSSESKSTHIKKNMCCHPLCQHCMASLPQVKHNCFLLKKK